jgi:excisionase family DNA binding protein
LTDRPDAAQEASFAENMQPLLLDCIAAAKLLGISPRTLWDLEKRGEVKSKRIGRRVLYSRAALEEFATK